MKITLVKKQRKKFLVTIKIKKERGKGNGIKRKSK